MQLTGVLEALGPPLAGKGGWDVVVKLSQATLYLQPTYRARATSTGSFIKRGQFVAGIDANQLPGTHQLGRR